MPRETFRGVLPPTITPLTDVDTVDAPALARHTRRLIDAGCNGIFVAGSTGEGPNLGLAAWQSAVETTVEAAAGDVPVYAGAIDVSFARVSEKIKLLGKIGADAAVVTGPFYFRSKPADLIEYFRRIADVSPVGVMAYNIPSMVSFSFTAGQVLALAEIDNIIGVKDSAGDWTLFQTCLEERVRPDFEILCGAEPMMAVAVLAGADGIVPGSANFAPKLLVELYQAASGRDVERAFALQRKLADLREFYWVTDYPFVSMKVAAKLLGYCGTAMSIVHPPVSNEQVRQIQSILVREGMLGSEG